jgi:hypothetical protein
MQAAWDMRLRPPPLGSGSAKCFSQKQFAQIALSNSIINIATDFLLALLPLPLIWRLQLGIRTKAILVGILSLGVFACLAGIIKSTYNKTILKDPKRFVHDGYSMWNFIELNVGIIAASLPTLKPLFIHFLEVAKGTTSRTKVSGYEERAAVSRQQDRRPNSWIMPRVYRFRRSRQTFGLSGSVGERATWYAHSTQDSEETILPLQSLGTRSDGIVVTRDYKVERQAFDTAGRRPDREDEAQITSRPVPR